MNETLRKKKTVGRVHRQNVLAEIRKHAGKPCPTNDEIGASLGGLNRNMVSGAIMALCAENILERKGTKNQRVLRVVATGEETAPGILIVPVYPPRDRSMPIIAPKFPQHVRFDDLPFDPDPGPCPKSWKCNMPPARKVAHVPERFRDLKKRDAE